MAKEISADTILPLAKDLIRIPSVKSEKLGDDNEVMTAVLNRAKVELYGFSIEEFVEPNTGTKSLLFYNTSERPELFRILLNGHLDVVPAEDKDQYNPIESDGRLIGRGSADMKAGVAVELLVFKHLAHRLPYPIALQLVTDEEIGGFNGTKYQVDKGVRADMVISGESTELDINNERKGVLVLEISTHGKAAHAARPYEGDNAAMKMAKLAVNLNDRFPIPDDDQWITTMNLAYIMTGNNKNGIINTENIAHNKVPAEALGVVDFRHIPQDSKENLIKTVKQLAPQGSEVRIDKQGAAIYVDPSHPDLELLARCIEKVTHKPANFIRQPGSSDSRHFAERGSVAIDFGPSGKGVHTEHEWGDIESYEQYGIILIDFLTSLKK